jgi:3-hydroxybutyryl-CoA dehydratase
VSQIVSNFTFDELTIGQSARFTKVVTSEHIKLFAVISGDLNPVHLDEAFAATTQFGKRIAHGMLTGAFISAGMAMQLPGPGSVYLGQSLTFHKPVFIGDVLTVTLTVKAKDTQKPVVTIECQVTNADGKLVACGDALVRPPATKETIALPAIPKVSIDDPMDRTSGS